MDNQSINSQKTEQELLKIIEKLEKKEVTIHDLKDEEAFALQNYVINQIRTRLNNFMVFSKKMLSYFDLAILVNVTIDKKELIEEFEKQKMEAKNNKEEKKEEKKEDKKRVSKKKEEKLIMDRRRIK